MKLSGKHIFLKFLKKTDAEPLARLHQKNRDFFQTYVPLRPDQFYTVEGQLDLILKNEDRRRNDLYYSFGIYLNDSEELIGNVMLSEVLRGSLQGCFIGYYLDQDHNGKGYTTEAVRLCVDYAFEELKLHRIEAGVMPRNAGSIRVLEKAGFHKEGIAKKNVKINGKWEDHQMLAIINENDCDC